MTTPGNHEKRHLAGSIHWRTGPVFVSPPGTSRNSELFIAHLDDLRRRLRRYCRIHALCGNAKFHTSHAVQAYLKKHPRIVLVLLPKYAPETNPTERIWWHLHETITRNHRCQSMQELVDQTFEWLADHGRFAIETSRYCRPQKA